MAESLDGSWAAHSCLLAHEIATAMPDAVRIEPQRTFHAFEATIAGLRSLLVDRPEPLDGITAMHLMAHLWWDEGRRDFLDVHAGMIDEQWVRRVDTTYTVGMKVSDSATGAVLATGSVLTTTPPPQ